METQLEFLPLTPWTADELGPDSCDALPQSEATIQFQTDVLNVVEGRVDINTFPKEYQDELKSYYRFNAIRQNTKSHNIAFRTGDTMDIVI